jgi:glyoxylase I family protein
MKLGLMIIFVSDLEEAKKFYSGILGFAVALQTGERLEFLHEGCQFIAFKCKQEAVVTDYGNVARSVFAFEVVSLNDSMSTLKSKGVEFLHEEPAHNDFCRYAAFRDPFGNVHDCLNGSETI